MSNSAGVKSLDEKGSEERKEIFKEEKTSSQQIPSNSQTSVPSNEFISDEEFLDELSKLPDNIEVPKIQKVPKMLLQNPDFKKYYEPTVMIIGPLHRRHPQIAPDDEPLKWNLASKFVRDSGATRDDLLGEIKRHVDNLKKRFNKDDVRAYDDDMFARMLFFDGCAVLQFISSFVSRNLKEVKINTGQEVLIQQDLLLLENQIPYRVLRLLIKKLPYKVAKSTRQRVHEFILLSLMVLRTQIDSHLIHRYFKFFRNIDGNGDGDGSANQPAHLLDFFRLAILLDDDRPSRKTEKEREEADDRPFRGTEKEREEADESAVIEIQEVAKDREEADEMASGRTDKQREGDKKNRVKLKNGLNFLCAPRIKERHFRHRLDPYLDELYSHPSQSFSRWSFRNVQDLRASGIRLRPSNSPSLTDVKFSSKFFFWGQLSLPTLVVDDSTSRKLLNLVAFEMCPDNYKNDFVITSYLSFLDSLIDIDQDVNDLRRAYILQNHLTSDSDVTQLFNTIGSNLFPDDTFDEVKNKIQKYYDRRSNRWVAQIYRDHFRNPWTILALLAGTIALFLTAVQTWFAAFRNQ